MPDSRLAPGHSSWNATCADHSSEAIARGMALPSKLRNAIVHGPIAQNGVDAAKGCAMTRVPDKQDVSTKKSPTSNHHSILFKLANPTMAVFCCAQAVIQTPTIGHA